MRGSFAIAVLGVVFVARVAFVGLAQDAAGQDSAAPGGAAPTGDAPTSTQATSRPADPLATPESAALHLFKLMGEADVPRIRAMLTDPPDSGELKKQVDGVAWKLKRGAKVELLETKVQGGVAVVLYRTIYPKGRVEISPVLLVGRYDRWKAILGPINPTRYTASEKRDMLAVSEWMKKRLETLNPPATQTTATAAEATQPTTTQPAK